MKTMKRKAVVCSGRVIDLTDVFNLREDDKRVVIVKVKREREEKK